MGWIVSLNCGQQFAKYQQIYDWKKLQPKLRCIYVCCAFKFIVLLRFIVSDFDVHAYTAMNHYQIENGYTQRFHGLVYLQIRFIEFIRNYQQYFQIQFYNLNQIIFVMFIQSYKFIILIMRPSRRFSSSRPNDKVSKSLSIYNKSTSPQSLREDSFKFRQSVGSIDKLPIIQMKKVLQKIGANKQPAQQFIPNEQEFKSFHQQKLKELKQKYSPRKIRKQIFDHELDPLVLDCWQYGQNYGRRTVWNKYRQKFDNLTFETLRVMKKKKI